MEQITDYIAHNWTGWLFAAITAFAGFGYRKTQKKLKEQSDRNKALSSGMEALLRDRIIRAYNHYDDKGYCPIYGKENVERMYRAYHALGGNDVATDLVEKIMKMKTEPEEEANAV